jgi:hypothetical protein
MVFSTCPQSLVSTQFRQAQHLARLKSQCRYTVEKFLNVVRTSLQEVNTTPVLMIENTSDRPHPASMFTCKLTLQLELK